MKVQELFNKVEKNNLINLVIENINKEDALLFDDLEENNKSLFNMLENTFEYFKAIKISPSNYIIDMEINNKEHNIFCYKKNQKRKYSIIMEDISKCLGMEISAECLSNYKEDELALQIFNDLIFLGMNIEEEDKKTFIKKVVNADHRINEVSIDDMLSTDIF